MLAESFDESFGVSPKGSSLQPGGALLRRVFPKGASTMPVQNLAFSLRDWLEFGQPFHDLVCHLFTNEIPPGTSPQLPDFQEANYPGYEPQLMEVKDENVRWTEKTAFARSEIMTWNFVGPGFMTQVVRGYWVARRGTSSDEELLLWERFAEPYEMMAAGKPFALQVWLNSVLERV